MQSNVQRREWNYSMITDNMAPTISAQKQKIGDQIWMLLAPIIIWSIWMARCTKVFSANKRPPTKSIKLIWHTLITTLRAQYERIDGTDDASELHRWPNFRKRWSTTPMAAEIGMDIRWQYVVPGWVFPPLPLDESDENRTRPQPSLKL